VEVVGVVFQAPNRPGDFGWMRRQPEWADALFVFNDNESQFRAFREGRPDGCSPGGGNARIRPWRCEDPPRAAGIPTGDGGGYLSLDTHVEAVLEEAFGVMRELLATGRYSKVVYSAETPDGLLGTSIFRPGPDVVEAITARLHALRAGA
jgi:hypothetical protein